jgi:hypothetical protein
MAWSGSQKNAILAGPGRSGRDGVADHAVAVRGVAERGLGIYPQAVIDACVNLRP